MKRFVFLLSVAALLAGCQTTKTIEPDSSILRVGVSPRSRPMIFEESGRMMGIEADFAQQLGKALNREVVFVKVPWEKQIDFLEQNKTDIIMSNMSITGPRSIRINFTRPYLQSGLSALFRRDQQETSSLIGGVIVNQARNIGFVKDTTGEFYSRQRFTRGTLRAFASPQAGVDALKSGKVDMFVHDAPVVWWQSAVNERELIAFNELLNVEPLAWGIGRHNSALLDEVNALLTQWDRDGTSAKIIKNWIPTFNN